MAASSTNSTIVIVWKNDKPFYFGSVSAIFEVFSRDDIGASLRHLHGVGLPYSNPKTAVRIERAKLVRKAKSVKHENTR